MGGMFGMGQGCVFCPNATGIFEGCCPGLQSCSSTQPYCCIGNGFGVCCPEGSPYFCQGTTEYHCCNLPFCDPSGACATDAPSSVPPYYNCVLGETTECSLSTTPSNTPSQTSTRSLSQTPTTTESGSNTPTPSYTPTNTQTPTSSTTNSITGSSSQANTSTSQTSSKNEALKIGFTIVGLLTVITAFLSCIVALMTLYYKKQKIKKVKMTIKKNDETSALRNYSNIQ